MDKKQKLLQERSSLRMFKEVKKRIETTMIGSLASIEKYFAPYLWGAEEPVGMSQEGLKELYEELRSEILDKGNDQIRNFKSELSNFDVVWNKYHIDLPIKPYITKNNQEG